MQNTKIRIVIVDDNLDLIFLLKSYISQKEDMVVVGTATNGLYAVKLITELSPDVVIMDIVMPMLDGLGVLEKLKAIEKSKKPMYIILSAIAPPKVTQIAFSLGAEYFIMKPFDPEALISRIRQLLLYKNSSKDSKLNAPLSAEDMQHKIIKIFNLIGMPIKLKGYQYLIDAIIIVVQDISAVNSITKKVYPVIASKNKISSSRVERAIRNAIEITWTRGNLENINSMFETNMNGIKTRPSNSEFISKIVYILLNSED